MALYDSNDLFFTWDGDIAVGPNGDIQDCSEDLLSSLQQEIATIVKSDFGDWEFDKAVGCNLSDFLGEPNTRETGKAIENRIRIKLVETGIVTQQDLDVKVTPISVHQVMIMIRVLVVSTARNRVDPNSLVSVNLLYDSMENNLFFMPPTVPEGS